MPTTPGALARRIPAKGYAAVVAALTLAVSALFGGLDAAPDTTPEPAANHAIDAGPWTVTVVDARVFDSQPDLTVTTAGDRWFAVVADVDVTANAPVGDLSVNDLIRVAGVTGLRASGAPQETILARDGSDVGFLNPGMPERIAFAWEQQSTAPIPATVSVSVYGQALQADTLGGGRMTWFDTGIVATVTAPVVDKRG